MTDIVYALKQLQGIDLPSLNHAGQYRAADRVQRAVDALERAAHAALPATESEIILPFAPITQPKERT